MISSFDTYKRKDAWKLSQDTEKAPREAGNTEFQSASNMNIYKSQFTIVQNFA